MGTFAHRDGELYAEEVALREIGEKFGTPCYVYSKKELLAGFNRISKCFGKLQPTILYAVKANSNLSLLKILADAGAGFDIVSAGELQRVLAATGSASKTVFSGVGKTQTEIEEALSAEVMSIHVESFSELKRIAKIAANRGVIAPVGIRVNPDVDPETHPYITTGLAENKFGVNENIAYQLCLDIERSPVLRLTGIGCHIGSQVMSPQAYWAAADCLSDFLCRLEADDGIKVSNVDLGGGFGIDYETDSVPDWTSCAEGIAKRMKGRQVMLEPGRSIVARAGVLMMQVQYLKSSAGGQNLAVVDAAMNDFMRPVLYGAKHRIEVLNPHDGEEVMTDIVGPICESGDFLAKGVKLHVSEGAFLALMDAGAYGFAMASNYNTRLRPCEVLVDGGDAKLIRRRESVEDLLAPELQAMNQL